MPRYFFHIREQHHLHEDEEGTELPDLHAALEEALRSDHALPVELTGIYGLEYEITDSSGKTVLKVPIQERRQAPRSRAKNSH
jgi:hypothetical protein